MAHTEVSTSQLIQARVGLSIGLRGVNITLLETACEYIYHLIAPFSESLLAPADMHVIELYRNSLFTGNGDEDYENNRPFPDEIINYEEQFSWADPWGQGRQNRNAFMTKWMIEVKEVINGSGDVYR